jgi:hypothetical protein
VKPCDDPFAPGDDLRTDPNTCRDDGPGRNVAALAQVFLQGTSDYWLYEKVGKRRDVAHTT